MNKWLIIWLDPTKLGSFPQFEIVNTRPEVINFDDGYKHILGAYEITGRAYKKSMEWKEVLVG